MPKDSADKDADRTYAELLNFHLTYHGTRPDGDRDRHGKLWQYEEFAMTAGISSRSLRNYRSGSAPPTSDAQNRIERAFFGENKVYDAWRERLRRAASLVDDIQTEIVPFGDWNILPSESTAGVAELRLHQPRPGNVPHTYYVEATLRLEKGQFEYKDRTVSIGLTEAFLSLESPNYQTTKRSMIGERAEHAHFEVHVGGVKIKGPRPDVCLEGDPLGAEYLAIIEPTGDWTEKPGSGTGIVTVSLHVGRSGFDVAPVDNPDGPTETMPLNKRCVLDAIVSGGLGRDRQGRLILARSKMQRRI